MTDNLAETVEKQIRAHRVRQERRLYELVGKIHAALKDNDYDPVRIMQTVTSWKDKGGFLRSGGYRPELLSDHHLERSIADAEDWLREEEGNG